MSKRKKEPNQQGSQYDKIWRENMRAALPGIIKRVLKIDVSESKDLPDKVLITKQREVDVLQEVTDSAGNRFVLHIEIQVRDDPDMVYRMAEYCIMIERQYRMPVRQYVIYIGRGRSKMVSMLDSNSMHFGFNLISLSAVSYKLFLSSDLPEDHLLAVLGNFDDDEPETVLSAVIEKVQQSAKSDFSENRYLQQLRILVQLRNLAKQFDHAMESVSKFFKEEKDPFYQRGVRKGKEEGIELKNQEVVQNLINELGLSDEQTARVAGVTVEFVQAIRASLAKK